jgi:AraC family transcriptional regulator
MLRQYNLLDNVLIDIEKGVKEGIYLNNLAEKYDLSEGHLRRLFRFAFKRTLGSYIRSRKLSASLDDLQKKDFNILDVALEYGFEYEQSYRRAFKNEFGITPGEYRKAGHIVKTKPPLHLFDGEI